MEWDWDRGAESLERAIALDPSNTWAYWLYGMLLTYQGRFDEAIEQMRLAQRLDPVATAPIIEDLGSVYSLKGDLESAAKAWQEALELSPHDYNIHRNLGNYLCRTGDFEGGLRELEQAVSVDHDEERGMADLAYCHALAGNREKAEEYLRKLEERAEQRYVDPVHLALVHLGLGERDRTLELLERAYEIHAQLLCEVPADPRYAGLHADPRYEALLRGIGLGHLVAPLEG